MTLWGYIIANTSQSPARLLAFGALCIGGTYAIGSAFSKATTGGLDMKQKKIAKDQLSYDSKRIATAQQERLSLMLKDMANGKGEDHWKAIMRGTLVPHPGAENKTEALDRERLANALSSAKK